MPERAKLRLIEGRELIDDFSLVPQNHDGAPAPLGSNLGRPMLRRPGDHIESVWLEPTAELKTLRLVAGQTGLYPDTAIAIVIERRLAISELCGHGDLDLIEWLGSISEEQQPNIDLWSAHAAYLKHLLYGVNRWKLSPAELSSSRVALPIRIIDRIGQRMPAAVETPDMELENSISWEVAALLGGETLGEWAYRTAFSRHRAPLT